MNSDIGETDWADVLHGKNANETWDVTRTRIHQATHKHTPEKRKKKKKRGDPWVTPEVKRNTTCSGRTVSRVVRGSTMLTLPRETLPAP